MFWSRWGFPGDDYISSQNQEIQIPDLGAAGIDFAGGSDCIYNPINNEQSTARFFIELVLDRLFFLKYNQPTRRNNHKD